MSLDIVTPTGGLEVTSGGGGIEVTAGAQGAQGPHGPQELLINVMGLYNPGECLLRYECGAIARTFVSSRSRGSCDTPATGSHAFNVTKNGTQAGTVTFGAGAHNGGDGVVCDLGTNGIALVNGDILRVFAPTGSDLTLAFVSIILGEDF
jgi:hypothetical protein